jgi:hypothetical protein
MGFNVISFHRLSRGSGMVMRATLTGNCIRFRRIIGSLCALLCVATFAQETPAVNPAIPSTAPATPPDPVVTAAPNELESVRRDKDYQAYLKNQLQLKQTELELTRVKMELSAARRHLELMQTLAKSKVATGKELEDAQKNLDECMITVKQEELKLEQARIDILDDATSVTVLEAKKYRTKDEKRMVSVTVINDSNANRVGVTFESNPKVTLSDLLTLHDICISLRKSSIIAEPYEAKIQKLALGEKATLTFQLLKDEDDVAVNIRWGQKSVTQEVYMKKEASEAFPSLIAAQFSQEGNLGQKIQYGLELEKLSEKDESYRLVVLNLPVQVTSSFVDPNTKAKMMQITFSSTLTKQQLQLELSIPEKLDAAMVDQTITFYILVTNSAAMKDINVLREKYKNAPIDEKEIEKLGGSKVRLELIPRGVGEIQIVSGNRYQEIQLGDAANFRIDLHNTGTLNLMNAKLTVDVPYLWKETLSPVSIPEIKPGNKEPVMISLTLPPNVGAGEYELRVGAEAENGTEKIKAIEKSVSIRVGTKTNAMGNAILIGGLILLVVGIAVASIRISRR